MCAVQVSAQHLGDLQRIVPVEFACVPFATKIMLNYALLAYCSLRNEMERNEMKRNEMEICSLQNGNL